MVPLYLSWLLLLNLLNKLTILKSDETFMTSPKLSTSLQFNCFHLSYRFLTKPSCKFILIDSGVWCWLLRLTHRIQGPILRTGGHSKRIRVCPGPTSKLSFQEILVLFWPASTRLLDVRQEKAYFFLIYNEGWTSFYVQSWESPLI